MYYFISDCGYYTDSPWYISCHIIRSCSYWYWGILYLTGASIMSVILFDAGIFLACYMMPVPNFSCWYLAVVNTGHVKNHAIKSGQLCATCTKYQLLWPQLKSWNVRSHWLLTLMATAVNQHKIWQLQTWKTFALNKTTLQWISVFVFVPPIITFCNMKSYKFNE